MPRVYSNDVPTRAPLMRRLTVAAVLGNGNYTVSDGGRNVPAHSASTFVVGQSVMGRLSTTAGYWLLR